MQKGFVPKISGTIEHTHKLAYVIRHAKRKQKTSVVTLLDLKNAFREVSHSVIPTVLQFHHIPREMQNIISERYSGFSTSIATKTSVTPGGGIGIPTDRDQRRWVFLNDPKNTLPLTENPKNTFQNAIS